MSGMVKSIAAIMSLMTAATAQLATSQVAASGQSAESAYHWSVTGSLGVATVGAGEAVKENMYRYGFNVKSPSFILEGTEYPQSTAGYQWMISGRYAFDSIFLLGMILSSGPLGSTTGYNDHGYYMPVDFSAVVFAPVGGVFTTQGLRFSIGPAIYATKTTGPGMENRVTKLGCIAELGLAVPSGSLLFFDASVQYRYVGTVTVGPFGQNLGNGTEAVLPACETSYNHFFFAAGLGVRF